MKPCKLVVIALILLASAWSAAPVRAAEPSGPITLAAPAACPAVGAILGAQAPPLFFSPSAPVNAASTCGSCSQSICVGKSLNSRCGAARLCQQVGTCIGTAPHCECLAPPAASVGSLGAR